MELSEHLFRHETGRMVATLTRIFGTHNLALAEDVVQDAFCRAFEVWKLRGVPQNPSAWLMATAKNRAIDALRRERTVRTFEPELSRLIQSEWTLTPAVEELFVAGALQDDLLRMMFSLALINDPELVFLDELTTGLNPQARHAIWDLVRGIRERGKTVFLTTHLMEEAERLCDRVAIIEHGRIIDIDSPQNLVKRHCPERTVVLATEDESAAQRFRAILGVEAITCNASQLTIRGSGDDLVTEVIHCLSENRIRVTDFRTILPTLEDVFLKLTGHSIRD